MEKDEKPLKGLERTGKKWKTKFKRE